MVLLSLLISCGKPAKVQSFVKSEDRDVYGRYVFEIDMSDTLSFYDMYLYARMDGDKDVIESSESLPLDIKLLSPDGTCYQESVILPFTESSSFFSRDSFTPYRTGCIPAVAGKWKMFIRPEGEAEGLCGIGLIVEYGKR